MMANGVLLSARRVLSPTRLQDPSRWRRRPVLAALLQVLAVGVPVLAALGVSMVLSFLLPASDDTISRASHWALFAGGSVPTFILMDRLARRIAVLASLLDTSMLFPDKAPSRLSVARQVSSLRYLRAELGRIREVLLDYVANPNGAAKDSHLRPRRPQDFLALSAALSVYDGTSPGHSERVARLADQLGRALKLSPEDLDRLRWAATLHDIGKLAMPKELLKKRAGLNADEWTVILWHPIAGAKMATPLRPWLGPWARAIGDHHERWDGTGYPRGIRGTSISVAGRIVAVADAYETMTSARSYKKPLRPAAARAELLRAAGTHFDPKIVDAFVSHCLTRPSPLKSLRAALAERAPLTPTTVAMARSGTQVTGHLAGAAAALALLVTAAFAEPYAAPVVARGVSTDAATSAVLVVAPGAVAAQGTGGQPALTSGQPGPAIKGHTAPWRAGTAGPATQAGPSTRTSGLALAPAVDLGLGKTVAEGGTYTNTGSFVDPEGSSWTALADYGDGAGVQALTLSDRRFTLSHVYLDEGTYSVTVKVTNNQGATGTDATTVWVLEAAPRVTPIKDATYSRASSGPFVALGGFTDPSNDTWTARVNYGDGTGDQALTLRGSGFTLSHTYNANGLYQVMVWVADDEWATGSTAFTVTVTD